MAYTCGSGIALDRCSNPVSSNSRRCSVTSPPVAGLFPTFIRVTPQNAKRPVPVHPTGQMFGWTCAERLRAAGVARSLELRLRYNRRNSYRSYFQCQPARLSRKGGVHVEQDFAPVDVAAWRRKTRRVMQPPSRSSRVALAALIAALLYLPGLGAPALWEPDEGRYAEIAREMVASGDYITPRDDLVRYFEKPPLVYWAQAFAIRLFGANEFAVRLPAALFTIGQVAATCLIG